MQELHPMLPFPPLAQLIATTAKTDAPPTPATPTAPTTPATPPANPNLEATPIKSVDGSATGPATTQAKDGKNTGSSLFGQFGSFLPIILMLVVLYFVLIRGQRKEEKKRKGMIAEMKKGDRVMTIGGLVARVVSIDGEEVVLKIDESANVKATYTKSSIQRVLGNEEKK
jgi:preprotein translocase subunit YajC